MTETRGSSSRTLPERILMMVLIVASAITFLSTTFAMVIQQPWYLLPVGYMCTGAFISLYLWVRRHGINCYVVPVFTGFILPIIMWAWKFNKGSKGPVPVMMILAAMVNVAISSPRRRATVAGIYIMLATLLTSAEWMFPEWIVAYPGQAERMLDFFGLVVIVTLPGITFLTSFVIGKYDEAHREADDAGARNEELLLAILPPAAVRELRTSGKVTPREYRNVSILFTDFADFTAVAAKLTPEELVAELDEIFTRFDELVHSFGLERIKTIGDSYMAVAGVPEPSADSASAAIQAALQMQMWINNHIGHSGVRWSMRAGIHTGSVTAGVVGAQRFAYDIWGDDVNIASPIESAGEPGKVNVSEATRQAAGGGFRFEPRGEIPVKGKGPLPMYFVSLATA